MHFKLCVLWCLYVVFLSYKERKWHSRKDIMLVKDSIDDKVNYLYILYYGVLHALVTMVLTNKILGKAMIVKELHGF